MDISRPTPTSSHPPAQTPPQPRSQPASRPRTQARSRPGNLRILQNAVSVAILMATLFVAFPAGALSTGITDRLSLMLTPQPAQDVQVAPTEQTVLRIGIVAGHWGYDSGAVCTDGTTEVEVNLNLATLVQQKLTAFGYKVDLLEEFDSRLQGYQAVLLVSIHNDSCTYINDQATGFKVAASMSSRDPNRASRLTACLRDRYAQATGLPFHPGSITVDMTQYHSFNEIDPVTTAAIIETGFMNLDFAILTREPVRVADGIVAGIICYLNNENVASTPMP
ncbi:MAG: N-acetylmuramoyl-L-alanine amidase [Chloroflexi bacterium]|nr:N-acetylmuramoyl-L-alanine amidase [Chloroflexota bacterium]